MQRRSWTAVLGILTALLCLATACSLPAQGARSRAPDDRQVGGSSGGDPAGGLWQVLAGDRTGPGQFNQPSGVVVDSQGNLFVADWENSRIQKLSPAGAPLAQWGARGKARYPSNPVSTRADASALNRPLRTRIGRYG